MSALTSAVAVVIPIHNGASWIESTLASVIAQTHAPREVIVVDDRSTDDGAARAAAFPGVRVITGTGVGADAARQDGLSAVRAPLVALLDQDDLWHPDHLRLLVGALEATPDAPAALAGLVRFADGDAPALNGTDAGTVRVDPWDCFPAGFYSTPSGVLIRRGVLDAVGGWPQGVDGVADTCAWLLVGADAVFVQSSAQTVGYRVHATSHAGVLRRERVLDYADAHVRACERAVDRRQAVQPAQAVSAQNRLGLARSFRSLVAGVIANDPRAVRDASEQMEQAGRAEPAAAIEAALNQAFWHLAPLLESPATSGRTWALVAGAWSRHAHRSGSALHRRLPARRVARALFSERSLRAAQALVAHLGYRSMRR